MAGRFHNITELLHRLGDIPVERVRLSPTPGTAVVEDLFDPNNRDCELLDGTLVEHAYGLRESLLTGGLITALFPFVRERNLGIVIGRRAPFLLPSGSVRAADVAYQSWNRMPGRRISDEPISAVAPELVAFVLCRGNTPGEMARKRVDFFSFGVRLMMEVDAKARMVRAFTGVSGSVTLTAADTLTGSPVLPGFTLPLADLFAELDRHG